MPKIVDHDRRRAEIVRAVWQLVEEGGFAAATMRDVAARAGFANGAIKHYFPHKQAMLAAAYQQAFDTADARMAASVGDRRGLEALRLMCLEMMPLDQVRAAGARVVLAFWDAAACDPALARVHEEATGRWIARLAEHVTTARERGEIRTSAPDDAVVDELVCVTMGLQVVPTLLSGRYTTARQLALLDAVLERLGRP